MIEADDRDARPYLREAAVARAQEILEKVKSIPPSAPLTLPPGFGEKRK